MAHHSVAVALVMMMMVSWSTCMMANKSIASTTTGNSTAAASSTWCNGNIVDGHCMLVADAAAYSGGEHSDSNLNMMDMEVMEYYDLGESSTRVLAGVTGKGKVYLTLQGPKPVIDAGNQKYIGQNCGTFNRVCPK